MPQYRKLYLKTTESLDINEMPDDFTRLLWLLLPLICCREGRGMDSPAWIKAKAMPLREDVKQERVEAAMCWYADAGMIVRYSVEGRRYFEIVNWARYQGDTGREAESNYPGQDQADSEDYSRLTHDLLTTNSCSDSYTDTNTNTNTDAYTEIVTLILETWQQLFPTKPQPRAATIKAKVKTRLTDPGFKDDWQKALRRVQPSKFCNDSGWFTLPWFLKSEEHWTNCLNGNYDNRNNGNDPPPSEPVAEGDYVDPSEFFGQGT